MQEIYQNRSVFYLISSLVSLGMWDLAEVNNYIIGRILAIGRPKYCFQKMCIVFTEPSIIFLSN